MITFNGLHCYIDNSWTRWFLIDEYKNIAMQGFIEKANKEVTDFPESYKNYGMDFHHRE